jgi:hypothetical protein
MMWVGLQIAKHIVKSNNNRLLMKPPEWIVALIPSKTWSEVGLDNNLGDSYYHNVFFPSIDNLRTNITMDMQPAVQLLSVFLVDVFYWQNKRQQLMNYTQYYIRTMPRPILDFG